MNYSENQIKLAGWSGGQDAQRDFAVALDFQGEGVRVLGQIGADAGEDAGLLAECRADASGCASLNKFLTAENIALTEENKELTDLANGTPGSCASTSYNISGKIFISGTVCLSGESGNLTASWNGTWVSPVGGDLSGNDSLNGRFVDSAFNIVGVQGIDVTIKPSFVGTNGNFETDTFSDTTTKSIAIPIGAIGMRWASALTSAEFYTYF